MGQAAGNPGSLILGWWVRGARGVKGRGGRLKILGCKIVFLEDLYGTCGEGRLQFLLIGKGHWLGGGGIERGGGLHVMWWPPLVPYHCLD